MPIEPFGILTADDVEGATFRPACLIKNTGSTTPLTTAVWASLNWGSPSNLVFDNDAIVSAYAPGVAIASKSGLWGVGALVSFSSDSLGTRHVAARINSVDDESVNARPVLAHPTRVLYYDEFNLAQGATVGIRGMQDSGVALTAVCVKFRMHLIAPTP